MSGTRIRTELTTLRDHQLHYEILVPRPREEVFSFFAAAENLEEITPPALRFEITSPLPIAMREGALIEYRLRLLGIPFYWKTRISRWEPGVRFVDEQLAGPYAVWVHTHEFHDRDGGTLVRDAVRYQLPFWPVGELAAPLVRLQLARIFGYRARRLAEIFAGSTR